MMRRLFLLALLLAPAWALAVDTPTNEKTFQYGLRLYLNGRYMDGDSGDVASAYPASEDTASKRQDLEWVGGAIKEWRFTPDSSEVYTIYARGSCCADTAISGLIGRYFQGADIPEGLISDHRSFAAGVIEASLSTQQVINLMSSDSTRAVRFDSLKAVHGMMFSSFVVQPGDTSTVADDLFRIDDSGVIVRNIFVRLDTLNVLEGALFSGIMYGDTIQHVGDRITVNDSLWVAGGAGVATDLSVGDGLDVDGASTLSTLSVSSTANFTSGLAIHQIDGSVTIGNDLIVEDNLDVDGRLDVDERADIADSIDVGTSYTAADSLAASFVMSNGFAVIDVIAHTLLNGVGTATIKVPGARPWDTTGFATCITGAPGLQSILGVQCLNPGEIVISRGSVTADRDFLIWVVKYR